MINQTLSSSHHRIIDAGGIDAYFYNSKKGASAVRHIYNTKLNLKIVLIITSGTATHRFSIASKMTVMTSEY